MPLHARKRGCHLVRLKLVRNRPFRKFFGEADLFSQSYVVDFENYAVDEIVELFTLFACIVGIFHCRLRVVCSFEIAFGFKALFFQKIAHLRLCFESFVTVTDVVGKKGKTSLSGNFGIEVSDCAGSAVSCVFKRFGCDLIVCVECGKSQDAFALNFDFSLIFNGFGQFFYGVDLRRYDLADFTVAPCGRFDDFAVFIQNIERKSVEFILASERRQISHRFHDAIAPFEKLIFRLALVKAVKSQKMLGLFKLTLRSAAHSVRGTVGQRIAFFCFERAQFVVKTIILRIGNDGSVLFVIQPCPLVESGHEFLHSCKFVHISILPQYIKVKPHFQVISNRRSCQYTFFCK